MVPFLSPAWLRALATEAASSEELRHATRSISLVVGHVVTGGPQGDVAFRLAFHHGTVDVATGSDQADVVLVEDYETAAALSRGQLTPSEAVAAGRLKVRGRVQALVDHQEAFSGLGDVFGALRATTTY